MTTIPSARNQDPTLYCKYVGGPRDGLKTGDLPITLSGTSLHGMLSSVPLAQPHEYSLYAVYECTSQTQVDGWWILEYRGLRGPNGEHLVAELPTGPAALDFEPENACSYRDCPREAVAERTCTDCGHTRDVCEAHRRRSVRHERSGTRLCTCTGEPVHYRYVPLGWKEPA